MAYTKEYLEAQEERRGENLKETGTLSINEIDPRVIKDYNIKVGQLTPWTRLRIKEMDCKDCKGYGLCDMLLETPDNCPIVDLTE